MSTNEDVRFLIFDIESVADPNLVATVRHPAGDVAPSEAVRLYRDELMEKKGSDFIPYTFQFPVSLALAKIRDDWSISGIGSLKFEEGGPGEITRRFWEGWLFYRRPTLVTFNGRGFDLFLLEQMAFRYGLPIPEWFAYGAKTYEQPRNRFNFGAHFDLCDFLTNYGATHYSDGLNLVSKMLNKAGKIGTSGDMVQDLFDAGRFAEIHDYCRCDVLDTYFVFLRAMRVCGRLDAATETDLTRRTRRWLEGESERVEAYRHYLEAWDDSERRPSLDDYCREAIERASGSFSEPKA